MNSNWVLNDDSTGVLDVTIDGEEWKKARDAAFNKLKKHLNLKGFRKGQVPSTMARQLISEAELDYQAMDDMMNSAFKNGVTENNIELVGDPAVDIKELDKDHVVYTFNVSVYPEVKLGQYKGLKVEKESAEVSDEQLNKAIAEELDRFADWIIRDEDEGAKEGDTVNIDFVGRIDGNEFAGGSASHADIELGSGMLIPGFEEHLVGIKPEEERIVKVTFPEDYQAGDLAGKEAEFTVTANEVKYKETPELSDELVVKMGIPEVTTAEEFKANLKKALEDQAKTAADEKFASDLLSQVVDGTEIAIPEVMIQNGINQELGNLTRQLQQMGYTLDQYLAAQNMTREAIESGLRPKIEADIKRELTLDAVAAAENIEISEDTLADEYKRLSEAAGLSVNDLKRFYPEYVLTASLKEAKAMDLIKDSANKE